MQKIQIFEVIKSGPITTMWYDDPDRGFETLSREIVDSDCDSEKIRVLTEPVTIMVKSSIGVHYFNYTRGYCTDWASIPKIMRNIVEDDQWDLIIPALIHDYLYNSKYFDDRSKTNAYFRGLIEYVQSNDTCTHKSRLLPLICWLGVESPKGRRLYREQSWFDRENSNYCCVERG